MIYVCRCGSQFDRPLGRCCWACAPRVFKRPWRAHYVRDPRSGEYVDRGVLLEYHDDGIKRREER